MNRASVQLPDDWLKLLDGIFSSEYMQKLRQFLVQAKARGECIYPPMQQIFRAFTLTDVAMVKVIIIGQDPYHGPHQANGLCFSVNPGVALPPSLRNIYQELYDDTGVDRGNNGDLIGWAKQGVLLLNAILTVRAHSPASHQKHGWEMFTDQVLARLCAKNDNLAIIAWGKFAQDKVAKLGGKHFIVRSAHPSPLSAHRGFFGSRPFSRVNNWLITHNKSPIDWSK